MTSCFSSYRPRLLRSAPFVAAALLSCGAGAFAQSDSYGFKAREGSIVRAVAPAAVRIFLDETGESYNGAGFVVDSREGLIVSATHVVNSVDTKVWVSFPKETKRHAASILVTGAPETKAYDFVMLKLDEPIPTRKALEVYLGPIFEDIEHHVTGFGRNNPSPSHAQGRPAWQKECSYVIRTPTLHGDSGSPILTPEGLVDAISVSGRESGGTSTMAETMILPLHCVASALIAAIPDNDTDRILHLLINGDDPALLDALQPERAVDMISNLRLAKAVTTRISRRKGDPKLPRIASKTRVTLVSRIITQRINYWDLAVDFAQAESPNDFAAGDVLQNLGDTLLGAGNPAQATAAYAIANRLYVSHADTLLPEQWNPGMGVPQALEIAKAYKGAADTKTKLAEVTKDEQAFKQAAALAAAAVFHAPNGRLKAASWAALGSASAGAGDYTIAVPAYREALGQKAPTPPWAKDSLLFAEKQLGDKQALDLGADYLASQADLVARLNRQGRI